MTLELRSSAFHPGGAIPAKHTCEAADLLPPLRWTGPPKGTQSFALIVDDPDAPAGTWVHWVLYDIPASAGERAAGVPAKDKIPGVGTQGVKVRRPEGDGRARARPRGVDGAVSAEVSAEV